MFKDYYSTLNIHQGANLQEVKEAFRRLALQYHPDINKSIDAHDKFIELTEAYEVLKDNFKRQEYDKIYKKYFQGWQKDDKYTNISDDEFNEKYKEWQRQGKQKSEEFASIPFDEFAKKLIKEMKIGANYVPNLLAILLTCSIAIGILFNTPTLESTIFSAILFYIAYRLLIVAKQDYQEERKLKIKP